MDLIYYTNAIGEDIVSLARVQGGLENGGITDRQNIVAWIQGLGSLEK